MRRFCSLLPACAVTGRGDRTGLGAVHQSQFRRCEDFFERWSAGGYFWEHLAGMFGVGLILYALLKVWGHYYVGGVGYATVQDVLSKASLPSSPVAGPVRAEICSSLP